METIEYKGLRIRIKQDPDPGSPREWDNLGTMVCFHNRYDLGDHHGYGRDNYAGWGDLIAAIRADVGPIVYLPLFLYDHSGISMNTTGFSCPWDSGQVGIIYASHSDITEEFGEVSDGRLIQTHASLQGEVDSYDRYLRGDFYGFTVELNGEHLDSCWGFYGYEYCVEEAKGAAEHYVGC